MSQFITFSNNKPTPTTSGEKRRQKRRHRCPHNPTRIYDHGGDLCLMTEYVDKYPQYNHVPPPQSLKPKQEYQTYGGKMEGITTFKSDYVPYEVAHQPIRVQEEYKPMAGEIDLGTTYRRDYNAHKIQPVTLVRPLERKYSRGGKLNTIPTYQDDYRAWEIQRREAHKVENAYHPPTEKFGNTTTFQDAFLPRELSPRKSFKPMVATKLSDQPFHSVTSHRSDYVPHQLEPKWVRSQEEYRPNSQPFEDVTTHRRDFRGLLGEVPKSFKPECTKVDSKAQFYGSTEFRDSFQPWAISLPEVHKAKEYIPPTGNMDLSSTTHRDYVPHAVSPIVLMRPIEKSRRNDAPFQGHTTMREAFQAWDVHRPEIIKRSSDMPKPSGRFEDMTTFRAHYIPHNIVPTQSCKPLKRALSRSAPFEDGTMYRTEYTPKKQEICPATYPSPPGFVYVSTDSRGHKFFRRVTPEINKVAHANGNHIPKEIAVVS
ncbi:stabilizer of axonemal microtubules 2 isoform X2 [Hemicordylus capensis]|uniref:stabilizer of axonemal microtubules 2 isoform X2 n=1 Tax=Hemicordylus capensis TaxID=884348 RepID=UPI00230283CA|nr:stabilizer of axonemal microtubules 2 isoform X2 [Hemicordylus capensis]XP_053128313.1 stabilizer of axonemal microtubules 2 isoform X2 [Hemicordylus capensis]XP_053128314.1 stabilizer of axonemal microtubules 2 isoform X2 [Hemicordylus capensis]